MRNKLFLPLSLALLTTGNAFSQNVSIDGFRDGIHHWNLIHAERNYSRYAENDFRHIADNVIAYQNKDGGWPKNIDLLGVLNTDSVYHALTDLYKQSTLDNRNTFPQIEYLAKVYTITGETKYRDASWKGLQYLLNTQYSNGGWRGWDVDAITFNDEVTTGAVELFCRILQGDSDFAWLNKKQFRRIEKSYRKGLDLILRCQVIQNGKLTAWAQQHDHKTLKPVGGRTFELPSLTADESCPIVMMLMEIKNPDKRVIASVKAAVAWLESVKIYGIRMVHVPLPKDKIINHEYPYDNVIEKDPSAKPIWARFYELSDNTPFFCTRQGVKVATLAEVNAERRTGYDWYGYWPEVVLKAYPEWLKRIGE